jgi:hypothetical protein
MSLALTQRICQIAQKVVLEDFRPLLKIDAVVFHDLFSGGLIIAAQNEQSFRSLRVNF